MNDFAREAPSLVEDAGGVPGGGVAFARSSSKAFWAAEYPAFALAKKSALKLIGGAAIGADASFSSAVACFLDSPPFAGSVVCLESSGFASTGFAAKLKAGALARGAAATCASFSSFFAAGALLDEILNEKPPAGVEAGAPKTPLLAVVEGAAELEDDIPKLNFCSAFFSSLVVPFSSSSRAA